jgi:Protein of unknown function (DUF2845)
VPKAWPEHGADPEVTVGAPSAAGFAPRRRHARLGLRLVLGIALALVWSSARAESLRCTGGSATEGDSKLTVAFKCGQPVLEDSFCVPVQVLPRAHPLAGPWAGGHPVCQRVDEWLYDRGPGNLVVTVRFRAGVVQSIVYGRAPR